MKSKRIVAAAAASALLVACGAFSAYASDADVAAINASSEALNAAFENGDTEAIRSLMTPDHVAVTPYFDGPKSVDEQLALLPDLKLRQTTAGELSVELLAQDVALRTFAADLEGRFKGMPLPTHVFVNETLVKRDGAWKERFYQVTTLEP
jgi:ketosteroid isomerase-like protein